MALEIKENRGIFELSGSLTTQNLGAIKIYFQQVLEHTDALVISLENITNIDAASAKYFEKLYHTVTKNNKVINIVGRQNNAIQQVMHITKTHYILSTDRV